MTNNERTALPTWSVVDIRTGKIVEEDLFLSEAMNYQSRLGNLKIQAQVRQHNNEGTI